ncbi:serine hydrolase domain-containing protein [Flectobacillus roseus]
MRNLPHQRILGIALGLGLFFQTQAQTFEERKQQVSQALPLVDQLFKEYAEKNHFPGMSYGIVLDGKLIHAKGVGMANLEQNIPATPQSAFRIASMTKSLTAMAIVKLRDEGKLQMDDPVWKYVPEMKNQKYATKDSPTITVRNLLTHSAGFPEDNPWGDRQLGISEKEFTDFLKKGISFSTAVDTEYEYSNLGFALLGAIIKKVSGIAYQEYINQQILKPLGMNHTYWEYTKVPQKELALGYRWLDGKWIPQPLEHDGVYGAMGGLITTMEDYGKYVAFHQAAWPTSDAPEVGPIKRSSVREMQKPWQFNNLNATYQYQSGKKCAMVSAYGYGLRTSVDCEGRRMVGHSGGLPGFGSHWYILQDYGLGVVSFANNTYSPMSYINIQILDTLLATTNLERYPIQPAKVLEERYVQLVDAVKNWENAKSMNIFAINFFDDYPMSILGKDTKNFQEKIGKVVKIHPIKPQNKLRGSFIVEGEKGKCEISLTLSPEIPALIQEYHFRVL